MDEPTNKPSSDEALSAEDLSAMARLMGKRGGQSRSEAKVAASVANISKAVRTGRPPIPWPCDRCGEIQPSKKAAHAHCK